jgi:hypothetical protein
MSVIAYVRYNRLQWYSRKYTIGYIANACNKHMKTQFDSINVFI